MAALCERAMKTGSMRMEPCATCDAERQMGEKRFSHSPRFGMMARYEMPYGLGGVRQMTPSFCALPLAVTMCCTQCESMPNEPSATGSSALRVPEQSSWVIT